MENKKPKKAFRITDDRFKYIGLILFLMFIAFLVFFYIKADEITKSPCSVCAKMMGEKVTCTMQGFIPISKSFYPNYTIVQEGRASPR